PGLLAPRPALAPSAGRRRGGGHRRGVALDRHAVLPLPRGEGAGPRRRSAGAVRHRPPARRAGPPAGRGGPARLARGPARLAAAFPFPSRAIRSIPEERPMMTSFDPRGEPPMTLAGRLRRLNDSLRSLAARLKDGIAAAVGEAAAGAARDAIRTLLGPPGLP